MDDNTQKEEYQYQHYSGRWPSHTAWKENSTGSGISVNTHITPNCHRAVEAQTKGGEKFEETGYKEENGRHTKVDHHHSIATTMTLYVEAR